MTKHTIEIEGLPEGWGPVSYRVPKYDEKYLTVDGLIETCQCCMYVPRLIVQKIKPREITLVETDEEYSAFSTQEIMTKPMKIALIGATKIWRIKEE